MLEDWVERLARELSVEPGDVDVTTVLDLARDAAHTIARPAAPVTTFVAGYAAGLAGGGSAQIADVVRRAVALIAAEGERLDALAQALSPEVAEPGIGVMRPDDAPESGIGVMRPDDAPEPGIGVTRPDDVAEGDSPQ